MNEENYISGMLERTLLFYDRATVDRVRNTVCAIAGLGGVGAITAELLARWGVKKFRLLDMDRYEPSNLNRQLFATSKSLGEYKVDIATERIREINPYAEIEMIIRDRVDNENVHPFVRGAGIIIQTADSPSCQLFYIAAKQYRVPIVNGFSTIIGCRVQAYDYRNSSWWYKLESLRDKMKWRGQRDLTDMTREGLCEFDNRVMHPAMPTMNFVTNIAGAMIVCEAIKLLTETGRVSRFPKIVDLDLYNHKMRIMNLYSLLRLETFRKIFGTRKGQDSFQALIDNCKKKVGVPVLNKPEGSTRDDMNDSA
jgi:molybdopterin/thiamine biosynthesis adenylyltransferase